MSIGKVVNNVTLVSVDDASVIKTVEVCKGIIDQSNSTVTVTKWGENILPWVKSLYPDEDTGGQTGRWRLNGLISSTIFFDRNKYDGTSYTYTMYEGDYDAESYRNYADQYCNDPDDISVQTSAPASPAGFRGYGFFVVYDDSWNSEKPRYAFVTAPAKIIGGAMQKAVITFPTPYVHNWTNRKGYISGDLVIGYNKKVYTDKIYENYTNSDYSSDQANGSTVYGFPYADGESGSKGGQGDMVDTSDPIEIDSLPILTTGDFIAVYKMSSGGLSSLKTKLVSAGFLDNLIAKLRTNAIDYIVGLNAIPYESTDTLATTVRIGNLDTEVKADVLRWHLADLDCGEINLSEYFQTFMDYSPYTKLSIYLPFCGIVPLTVDNFMNDVIKLKYRIDLLTGCCLAFISNSNGLVTTASGNCAYNLPIRSNDYSSVFTSAMGIVGGALGTVGAIASGNIPLAGASALGLVGGLASATQTFNKPDVASNGSLGGNFGLLGNRTPYLIIQRPTISVPKDYGKTLGYMSRISAKLGELKGYTKVEEIHLEHINATAEEKSMIENLLKEGVIL